MKEKETICSNLFIIHGGVKFLYQIFSTLDMLMLLFSQQVAPYLLFISLTLLLKPATVPAPAKLL